VVSGVLSIIIGVCYHVFLHSSAEPSDVKSERKSETREQAETFIPPTKQQLRTIFAIIFFTTALGGLIFQSTTFALPKVFEERLPNIADTASLIGWYAFMVFSMAAFAQLVVGYLVDHHSIKQVFSVVALLQAVFFAVMVQLTGLPSLFIAFAFMLVVFGQIPINDVLIGRMAKTV